MDNNSTNMVISSENMRQNSMMIQLVAGNCIPRDFRCGPVEGISFTTLRNVDNRDKLRFVKVFKVKDTLQTEDSALQSWTSFLMPARDVFEQNLQLFRSHDMRFYIRACKDIKEGEPLFCWYDEPLALEKNVPHLTPLHIQGSQHYCCLRCRRSFAFPNVLKIHIMYYCQENTRTSYNDKLQGITRARKSHDLCCDMVNFKRTIPRLEERVRDCNERCCTLNSSFESYSGMSFPSVTSSAYKLAASLEFTPTFTNRPHSIIQASEKERNEPFLEINGGSSTDRLAADLESEEPMDVLSKSFVEFSTKDGYMCIYCGKLYSRKYGLKIHLRTHTGYKPLKCQVCFRAFGDPSNLNKHVRLHSQSSAPYQCMHCGKILVRRRDLARHLKSRHPHKNLQTESE